LFLIQILASKGDVGVFRGAKRNTTVPKVVFYTLFSSFCFG
jgi:hypothetical protein